jgi:hypothetical protein
MLYVWLWRPAPARLSLMNRWANLAALRFHHGQMGVVVTGCTYSKILSNCGVRRMSFTFRTSLGILLSQAISIFPRKLVYFPFKNRNHMKKWVPKLDLTFKDHRGKKGKK